MNEFTYMGFLFGLGFTMGAGLLICIGLGVTSLQRRVADRFKK